MCNLVLGAQQLIVPLAVGRHPVVRLAPAVGGPVKSADAHSQMNYSLRSQPGWKTCPRRWRQGAFESPKVAAHGDFACTAAMQLAKPLKLNLRALGEQLRLRSKPRPPFQRWVSAIEIAGPGFLNIRLQPAAKQQVVREVLTAGERFGYQPATASRCWSSSCRPTHGPAARGPRPPGRAGRCDLQPVQHPGAGRCTASSITTTRACRSTR